jgi:hypothetical protein
MSAELYLVCKLVRKGRMVATGDSKSKSKKTNELRRPFGCAVLHLTSNHDVYGIFTEIDTLKIKKQKYLELQEKRKDTPLPSIQHSMRVTFPLSTRVRNSIEIPL